ncbi:MAG: site-2 protease family protein [Acidobacteriota bacterium]
MSSTEIPEPAPSFPETLAGTPDEVAWVVRVPPAPKFQHKYRLHIILFALTFITTTYQELLWFPVVSLLDSWQTGVWHNPLAAFAWPFMRQGLWYSLPVLAIISAHEFGHYFACRAHNVDATLPYYLPAPIPLSGTFGAVIRIREPFPSKAALFDIGVAGPIAGFVMLLPFMVVAMKWSFVAPIAAGLWLGEPLIWKAVAHFYFGTIPAGMTVYMHPMGMASWMGMLMTALNLLPFGQLDGGHIMYAALGRRAHWFSAATLAVVVLLAFRSPSWYVTAGLLVVMAMVFGFRHPRVYDEDRPLDPRRTAIAIIALVIFVLCFMPVPIA